MHFTIIKENGIAIALVSSDSLVLCDIHCALDLLATAQYQMGCSHIAISKHLVTEKFFTLRTGLAGEILQKFITYQTKIAIYGDFSTYTSKPLHDFIYESNKGNHIFFVDTQQQAISKLATAL